MEDKATIISIEIPTSDHTDFMLHFNQTKPLCVWLDWDDGSQRTTFSEEGLVKASHTYSEAGQYNITLFAVDEATIELVTINEDIGYRDMVTSVIIGEDVTRINDFMFSGCNNLESVEFLCEQIEIGDYAFANCISLESIDLPVTNISKGCFFNCSSLKRVNLPEEGVSTFYTNAFYGCSQLKTINLNKVYSIGDYAFHGCRKLSKIELAEGVHDIGTGAFDSCSSIRTITIDGVLEIGDRAFCNCQSVLKVRIPENVKSIGDNAFYNCNFLTEMKILCNEPPILKGTQSLPANINFDIIVPDGLKHQYAEATNWNLFIDKIKEESL